MVVIKLLRTFKNLLTSAVLHTMLYESILISSSACFHWYVHVIVMFIHLLKLLLQMLSSGLPGLASTDDILYVRDALLPGKSDLEAAHIFTKLVLHILCKLGLMSICLLLYGS